jgi:hypothetical protein
MLGFGSWLSPARWPGFFLSAFRCPHFVVRIPARNRAPASALARLPPRRRSAFMNQQLRVDAGDRRQNGEPVSRDASGWRSPVRFSSWSRTAPPAGAIQLLEPNSSHSNSPKIGNSRITTTQATFAPVPELLPMIVMIAQTSRTRTMSPKIPPTSIPNLPSPLLFSKLPAGGSECPARRSNAR